MFITIYKGCGLFGNSLKNRSNKKKIFYNQICQKHRNNSCINNTKLID